MDNKRKASASRGPGAAGAGAGTDGDSPPAKRRKLPSVSRARPPGPVHCPWQRGQAFCRDAFRVDAKAENCPPVTAALGRKEMQHQSKLQAWHGIGAWHGAQSKPMPCLHPTRELHLLSSSSFKLCHFHPPATCDPATLHLSSAAEQTRRPTIQNHQLTTCNRNMLSGLAAMLTIMTPVIGLPQSDEG